MCHMFREIDSGGREHEEDLNEFGFNVFKEIAKGKSENQCFSPISCYTCLAMSVPIFDGETRQSLLRVLHLRQDITDEECMKNLKVFFTYDKDRVDIYSRVCANKGKSLPAEMFACQRAVGIPVEERCFNSKLVSKINEEVSKATHGMLSGVLQGVNSY